MVYTPHNIEHKGCRSVKSLDNDTRGVYTFIVREGEDVTKEPSVETKKKIHPITLPKPSVEDAHNILLVLESHYRDLRASSDKISRQAKNTDWFLIEAREYILKQLED